MRYDFSSISLRRTARQDLVLDGHEIKAGEMAVAWVGAALFDEEYLPQAEQFDIRRSPNPYITFGCGIHVCPGASLARLESKVALERNVAHFSSISPDLEKPLRRGNGRVQQPGLLFTPAHAPGVDKP